MDCVTDGKPISSGSDSIRVEVQLTATNEEEQEHIIIIMEPTCQCAADDV